MKKILLVALLVLIHQSAAAYEVNVPENISYYEYCYASNQCEVPEDLQSIISQNFQAIAQGQPSIY